MSGLAKGLPGIPKVLPRVAKALPAVEKALPAVEKVLPGIENSRSTFPKVRPGSDADEQPLKELLLVLADASPEEMPDLLEALDYELTEFEDDGSKSASELWFQAFETLRASEADGWKPPQPSWELAIAVRARLASFDEFAGELEALLSDKLLRERTRAKSVSEKPPALERCFSVDEPDRYVTEGAGTHAWVLIQASTEERNRGRTGLALEHLMRAELAVALQRKDPHLALGCVGLERASCFQRLGRSFDALRALVEVRREASAWEPSPNQVGDRDFLMGSVSLALIRQWTISERFESALREIPKLREAGSDPRVSSQLDYYEASARRALGETSAAKELLVRALANQNLPGLIRGMALLEKAELEIQAESFDVALDSLEQHSSLIGEDPQVLPLQRSRAVALSSRLARMRGLSAEDLDLELSRVQRAFERFLESLKSTDDGMGVGSLAFAQRRYLVGELIELTLAKWPGEAGLERVLAWVLEARARGALARSLGVAVAPTLAQARELLLCDDKDGLIVLLPSADYTHLFALDRKQIRHARLNSLEVLKPAIEDLWSDLAGEPKGGAKGLKDFERRAADLGQELFPEDIAKALASWTRVHVVGSDLLERLPLGVLSVEGIGVLGLERELVHLPSVAVGLRLRERDGASQDQLLALVSPMAAKGALPTPEEVTFDPRARQHLEAAWSDSQVEWRTKKDAQVSAFAVETPASALLLFAHGERDNQKPRPLAVRVAPSEEIPDGRLFPDTLEALAECRVPSIVVLAACGVADAELKAGGDDSDHLGASFLRRGARLVLISSAPLEQVSTSWLCAYFLEGIAQGQSAALALKNARRQLRARPGFEHPHYWGTLLPYGLDAR